MSENTSVLRVIEKKKFDVIELLAGFEAHGLAPLDAAIEKLLTRPKHLLINLAGLKAVDSVLLEKLHFIDQQLRTAGKKTRILFAGEQLQGSLAASRFGQYLTVSDSLAAAMEDLSAQSDLSSRQFIKAFVNATLRTFYVQAKTSCRRGTIFVKSQNQNRLMGDISGIIHVVGATLSYGVMLSFPKDTFLKLVARLLGEQTTEINQENQDAATELMNIIFGQAKLVLNLKGAGLTPQLPVLALGQAFRGLPAKEGSTELTPLEAGKTIVIPFESDMGEFFTEVWIPNGPEGANAASAWFPASG